ncbi:MAG: hypothetical protein CM1200mP39_17090 [Dehalococcoidia bacterium]|nr:MAG: hypothetical protein CM1200mP39_17090 [Dehalococcoidia bacterium]
MTMEQRVDYSLDVLGVKMMGATKEWAEYGRKKTGPGDACLDALMVQEKL